MSFLFPLLLIFFACSVRLLHATVLYHDEGAASARPLPSLSLHLHYEVHPRVLSLLHFECSLSESALALP